MNTLVVQATLGVFRRYPGIADDDVRRLGREGDAASQARLAT